MFAHRQIDHHPTITLLSPSSHHIIYILKKGPWGVDVMTKMSSRAANEPLAAEFSSNLAADVPVPIAGGNT